MTETLEFVRDTILSVPKTELHIHLDGSLRPETMIDLAAERGVSLPDTDPEQLRDHMIVSDAHDLVEYLARFSLTLAVMQDAEAAERIAYELCLDNAAENVDYLEIRYSPALLTKRGMSLEEAVEAPLRGFDRARAEVGIEGGLIICGIRTLSPQTSVTLAELAAAYAGRGVLGFDLAGAEAGNAAHEHREAFDIARRAGLGITVHAGEAAGPESIRQAIDECGARRLGHATHLFQDPALMRRVRDEDIAIEVCLTSNVQTHAVAGFEDHPLRLYFDEGLNVSLHTDNRLMSGTTVTDEYVRAAEHLGFSLEELLLMVRNGYRSAFDPDVSLDRG
jgi:adenosine deaminase